MQRVTELSPSRLLVWFAALCVATALVMLGVAVFTGRAKSFEDATRFDQKTAPDVRYVMNYEVDPTLFSFYADERGSNEDMQAVAQRAGETAVR